MTCNAGEPEMTEQLLKVVVHKRQLQGDGVVVLDLLPVGGTTLPAFEAGAHVDIHVAPAWCQYSLCSDPADSSLYRLGVLKDPASRGAPWACMTACWKAPRCRSAPAQPVPTGHRCAPFDPHRWRHRHHPDDRHGPCAAGCRQRVRAALLWPFAQPHRFSRRAGRRPFAGCVQTHFDDEPAQKLDLPRVLGTPQADVHVYVCGPAGFMDWVIGAAREAGYAEANIHREYFQVEVDASGDAFEVVAARSKTVQVAEGRASSKPWRPSASRWRSPASRASAAPACATCWKANRTTATST